MYSLLIENDSSLNSTQSHTEDMTTQAYRAGDVFKHLSDSVCFCVPETLGYTLKKLQNIKIKLPFVCIWIDVISYALALF